VLVEADITPSAGRWVGNGDLTRWYRMGQDDTDALTASISRADLWTAAWSMIRENPFSGVGPDNYRLLYGRYLGYSDWNKDIHANNLYLELLAGSGIPGLLSFVLMMTSRKWNLMPVSLALGVFLVHGLVDVFVMTTPIYFGFWILMGLSQPEETTP
jgi:O-antigen ligase